jgi:hypothetical protein
MNAMWWSIAGTIAFSILWFIAASKSERAAIKRRCGRLTSRQPLTIDEWQRSIPSVKIDTLAKMLPLIGAGLDVPYHYLYPTDAFDDELSLKDRFWCLIADDDSRESIADAFDSRYNQRPSGEWTDLRDVVLETCSIVQSGG